MTYKETTKHCPLISKTVTLCRQTTVIGEIGNPFGIVQREFGCSAEKVCANAMHPKCMVRSLNQAR